MTVGIIAAAHHHWPLWSIPGYKSNSQQVVAGAGGYFTSWDSFWYLNAAQHGWPQRFNPRVPNTTGFFPGLPILLRVIHWVVGANWVLTGILVEVAIEIAMVAMVSLVAREVLGPRLGLYATLLFCLFPGAYVFSLVYSEPLYIFGVAICLYGLLKRNWWLAGGGSILAGVTRPTGVVLIILCFLVAARELWVRRDRSVLIIAFLSPLGLVSVSLFFWIHSGSPLAYQETQSKAWFQTFKLDAVTEYFRGWLQPGYHVGYEVPGGPTWVLPLFIILGAVGIFVLAWLVLMRHWPLAWLLYSLGSFGVTLLTNDVGFRPRMALTALPLIFAVAWVARNRWSRVVVIGISLVGLVYFSASIPYFIP